MSTKLKQFFVDTYGFRDKRIKDIKKKSYFTIDKCPTNSAGDYNAAACRIFLRVEGEEQFNLQLSRNAPLNASIQKLIEARGGAIGGKDYERSIIVKLSPFDSEFIRQLATAVLSVTADGAPRYAVPSYKYTCPEIAHVLQRLADHLDKYTKTKT
jgi:hypothetical protein